MKIFLIFLVGDVGPFSLILHGTEEMSSAQRDMKNQKRSLGEKNMADVRFLKYFFVVSKNQFTEKVIVILIMKICKKKRNCEKANPFFYYFMHISFTKRSK